MRQLSAIALVVGLLFFSSSVWAGVTPADVRSSTAASPFVKRKVLALYDGSKYERIYFTPFHQFIEMPLNHIGLELRYQDIRDGYPKPAELKRDYRGIITWFNGPLAEPGRFFDFMEDAMKAGLRYVTFGDPGIEGTPESIEQLNRLYRYIGLRFNNGYVSQTIGSRIEKLDRDLIGFEHPLDPVLPAYVFISSVAESVDVHLQVQAPSSHLGKRSILVATGPGGGLVLPNYALAAFRVGEDELQKWIINPFLFFAKAFAIERFPIPDITTIAGRRLYFSHVDGDGWNNISHIDGYRQKGVTAAQVMLEKLIEPYPDLPVTVGIVTGDCDDSIGGDRKAIDIARKIFALPQVEVASHTHTHPFDWSYYKNYSRAAEEKLISLNATKSDHASIYERALNTLTNTASKLSSRERNRKYVAGGALEMPRAYLKHPFDLNQEILQSLRVAESFAPPDKKARLLQWSGDTSPFEGAIRMVRQAGVLNINGGDTRFDAHQPSIRYVAPISRLVGKERQIYAVNSNENTYTDLWTRNFHGLSHLSETLKNTESPRRLKGFNLYYHSYSAERAASLQAVIGLLATARNGPYIPVSASHYAQIANDFFVARLEKISFLVWRVHNRGALQTFRFDDADDTTVDWRRSHGVIGQIHHGTSLYVALDSEVKDAIIALRKSDDDQATPHLIESRWQVRKVTRSGCHLTFNAQGFGHGDMVWSGFSQKRFQLAVSRGKKNLFSSDVTKGADATLRFSIPIEAQEAVEISLNCHEEASSLPASRSYREAH